MMRIATSHVLILMAALLCSGCAQTKDPGETATTAALDAAAREHPRVRECSSYPFDAKLRFEACSDALRIPGLSDRVRAGLRVFRGSASYLLGHVEEAIDDLDEAIRLDPTSSEAQDFRGTLAMSEKNIDEALGYFNRAIEFNPTSAEALSDRGWALVVIGDYEAAIPDLDRSIKLKPFRGQPYYWRAAAHRALGNMDIAKQDLAKAEERSPGIVELWGNPLE